MSTEAQRLAEEAARIQEENAEHAALVESAVGDDPNPEAERQDAAPERRDSEEKAEQKPLERMTAADRKRLEMAKRFRERRDGEGLDYHGDHQDPTQTYGEVAAPPDDAAVTGALDQPKPKRQLKVNGKVMELDEDEVIALAQKAAAAEDILERAKATARAMKENQEEPRAEPSRPHQDARPQPTDEDELEDPPNQEDPFTELVEKIQFGDPAEAAQLLRNTISEVAAKRTKEDAVRERVGNEIASRARALNTIRAKQENADVVNDPRAEAVIERTIYDLYAEDLQAVGLPAEEIPKDKVQLANWHAFYRAHGHPVRSFEDVVTTAITDFRSWKPGKPAPQPANPGAPRVNVDRDQRRAAIPTQPSRASAPPRPAAPSEPQAKSRSDIIRDMRKARGQIVA